MKAALRQALEEQQSRVWHLRSLLQCVQQATENENRLDDLEAAITGLIELADAIHLALDTGTLEGRAQEIVDEAARRREREEAYRQREEEARRDQAPDAPASVN